MHRMASILEGKQNVKLPKYSSNTSRPNNNNLQFGNVCLMRRPDDNECNYQARFVNYNDNSYQGRAMENNPNQTGIVFTYDK